MTKGVSADIISIDTVYIDVPEVDTTNLNVDGDISDIFEENNVNPVIFKLCFRKHSYWVRYEHSWWGCWVKRD